jgi:hypothetical protein
LGAVECNNISNVDITNALKNCRYFRGVYPIDLLPKKLRDNECGVVNLDKSTGPGTHWVCYYNDRRLGYVEYFDPYGEYQLIDKKRETIPKPIVRYLRSAPDKAIMYNDSFIQAIDSKKCGCFVITYIKLRDSGLLPETVLQQFTEYPSDANELKVLQHYI